MEIRCDNHTLFGIIENHVLEVKCRNRRCGYEAGKVILHQFDLVTGELLGTQQFKDPSYAKEVEDAADNDSSSLRSA